MTLGPLEYVMVAFEGNRFSGQILAELRAAQEKGIIRVIDLLVIKKDEQANVMALELSDLSEEEARPFGFLAGGLLNIFEPDDVEVTASQMPNNSAAGHHSATKSAEQQQEQQASQQPPPPPPPQAAAPAPTGMTNEKIEQLKQLGQLHESGILTDTEFEAQKQKILNS